MAIDSDQGTVEFFDDISIQDPYPLYRHLREQGPVHRVGDSDFYLVCGWDEVNDAISRPGEFSSNLTATMTYEPETGVSAFLMGELGGPTQVLATADDPAHAAHRKMLVPQLAAKRIRGSETFIAETAELLLDERMVDGRIEWMSAVANRLPMMVVARLLGVPDDDVDMLIAAGYATTQLLDGLVDADQLAAAGVAAMELSQYVTEHFARAAIHPGDNLLGDLASACASGELDEMTATVMMMTLFSAGGESTASLLGSAMWLLATRTEIQRRLRAEPDLLAPFIEEVLRFEPPFRGHYRHVVSDTTLGGVELAAGSRLLLLWGAVNRDPAQFEQPDEFRLDRPKGKGHMTFGKGAHFCVGAALARLEATIVLGKALERTSWIEPAGVGRWLPSILVRRLERLDLEFR
ncbi:cytochrome P450 [Mycolicibacterium sp. 050232]|uniref:cytochrome P450 n=1 Tax=Mycolicibacterium sp. 050232 TaxID=3113982 RepID=UPI002E2BD63A|nr:cytochrome P450 [Mycolicibacterium sp. 050232]MED5810896.1 cytochrome P450 [Mycolicibacterium sp. 050232]